MINLNISQFTKSYCLMLIVMSVVVGMFFSCSRKNKVGSSQTTTTTLTLKVQKKGTGSITASWNGGSATETQLTTGVKIPQGTKVTLTATPSSDNAYVLWNNTTKSKTYQMTMDKDNSVTVSIVYQYLLTVSKTGKGIVTASWTGGSATDAQLSAGALVDENTAITLTATPDATTPNVAWNESTVGNTFSFTMTDYSYVSVSFSATPPTFFALNITDPSWKEGTITAYSDANRTMSITNLTQIAKDAKVYIKVVPEKGKKVTQLIGIDAGSANSDNTEAVVTMTSPKQLSALFETITYKLTLEAGTGGTIQAFTDEACTIPVADLNKIPYATTVYLKIIPNADWEYEVDEVLGKDPYWGDNNKKIYRRTMYDNHTITATFYSAFGFTETATTATLTGYFGSSTNVTILPTYNGKSVIAIGNKVFSPKYHRNINLTSITIPNSVTSIGDEAFSGSDNLESITMSSGVMSIGEEAFFDCQKLTGSIKMPNIISIADRAFYNCFNLESILIGEKIKDIEDGAFDHCYRIRSITVQATTPPTLGNTVLFDLAKIYVPKGSVNAYKTSPDWSPYASQITFY